MSLHHLAYGCSSNDSACRVLEPLQAAAQAYEAVEAWQHAAEAQHLLALVCNSIQSISMRDAAATAFHRLERQAKHVEAC